MLLSGHAQRGRTGEHECEVCLFPDMHRGEEFEKKKKKNGFEDWTNIYNFSQLFFFKKKQLRSLLKSITFIYVCMCVGWGGRYAVADIWRS